MKPLPTTDQEINVAVAEMAGWTRWQNTDRWLPHPGASITKPLPDYLHDADAVIALLAKEASVQIYWGVDWQVQISDTSPVMSSPPNMLGEATGDTFCRAACLALLLAQGAKSTG